MPDEPAVLPDASLVEVGRYPRLSEARERGLVIAAMELPHWVVRVGDEFALRVEAAAHPVAARELERYEAERMERRSETDSAPVEKVRTLSLYVGGWIMAGLWLWQNLQPPERIARGAAQSRAILEGEWWRTFTALTLHGDFSHFAANLATGLLFAAFALPRFGTGVTWLAIVLSGALGNLANAAFYQSQVHVSIGASTAVFGALGILTGAEFAARLGHAEKRGRWHLIVPLGAGLGLLAFFGVGEEHSPTDYMAHLWGFLSGIMLGAVLTGLRTKERVGPWSQRLAAIAAPGLLLIAWIFAW